MIQLPALELPADFDLRVAAPAALNVLIGLALIALPFLQQFYPGCGPGSGQTTIHVALGAVLTVLALFRASLAYRSAWVDGLIAALGILILTLPWTTPMAWSHRYLTQHVAAGGGGVLLALVGAAATLARTAHPA